MSEFETRGAGTAAHTAACAIYISLREDGLMPGELIAVAIGLLGMTYLHMNDRGTPEAFAKEIADSLTLTIHRNDRNAPPQSDA